MVNFSHAKRFFPALFLVALSAQVTATAGNSVDKATATLVYDARLREFRCWRDGAPDKDARAAVCSKEKEKGWHPVTADLYFVDGQSVNLLIINGVVEDLFSLDIQAADLSEPTTPISGAISALPSLLPISPAPTLIAGVGSTLVSGRGTIDAALLYRMLTTLDGKDFQAWLTSTLTDPLNAKEVTDLLAVDLDTASDRIKQPVTDMTKELNTVKAALDEIKDSTDIDDWLLQVRKLNKQLDAQASLRSRLVASGVAAAGATISNTNSASRATPIAKAAALDPAKLSLVTGNFATAFGDRPYAKINKISVAKDGTFENPDLADILGPINDARSADATLARLTANLTYVADNLGLLKLANGRRGDLEAVLQKVDTKTTGTPGNVVFTLQAVWNEVANKTITAAGTLNADAKRLPLGDPYDLRPVGQWFSTKTITLTVKQGQRSALFDLGGLSDATRAGVAGGDTPAAKSTQIAASDLAAARTITFPIYTRYHVKLGLGFVYSTAPDNQFRVSSVTTGSGSSAVTQQYINQVRARDYNLLATANVMIFPWARHAFPWRARFYKEPKPKFYTNLAAMMGFSITSPNRDFLLGGAYFPPTSPVGLQLGWHIALRDYPPSDVKDITQPLTDRVVNLDLKRLNGVSVGLVFTTDFFGKVFAPIFKK